MQSYNDCHFSFPKRFFLPKELPSPLCLPVGCIKETQYHGWSERGQDLARDIFVSDILGQAVQSYYCTWLLSLIVLMSCLGSKEWYIQKLPLLAFFLFRFPYREKEVVAHTVGLKALDLLNTTLNSQVCKSLVHILRVIYCCVVQKFIIVKCKCLGNNMSKGTECHWKEPKPKNCFRGYQWKTAHFSSYAIRCFWFFFCLEISRRIILKDQWSATVVDH